MSTTLGKGSGSAPGNRIFDDRGVQDVYARRSAQLTCASFTDPSVAAFLQEVAKKVRVVAKYTIDGPWRGSNLPKLKNALLSPAQEGTEPYWVLAALVLPKVMRSFMAGEPDNLREMADMMDYVAMHLDSPDALRDGVLRTALRWNAAMALKAEGQLEPVDTTVDDVAQAEVVESAEEPAAPAGAIPIDLTLDR